MEILRKIINIILDTLKKILVRFKNAKFGLLFIVDIFKLPDFMTDRRVNVLSKIRVVSTLIFAIAYFASSLDLVPEVVTGVFGFIDDILVLIWSLGIVSEEIGNYRSLVRNSKQSNIIENVEFSIKDEEE